MKQASDYFISKNYILHQQKKSLMNNFFLSKPQIPLDSPKESERKVRLSKLTNSDFYLNSSDAFLDSKLACFGQSLNQYHPPMITSSDYSGFSGNHHKRGFSEKQADIGSILGTKYIDNSNGVPSFNQKNILTEQHKGQTGQTFVHFEGKKGRINTGKTEITVDIAPEKSNFFLTGSNIAVERIAIREDEINNTNNTKLPVVDSHQSTTILDPLSANMSSSSINQIPAAVERGEVGQESLLHNSRAVSKFSQLQMKKKMVESSFLNRSCLARVKSPNYDISSTIVRKIEQKYNKSSLKVY